MLVLAPGAVGCKCLNVRGNFCADVSDMCPQKKTLKQIIHVCPVLPAFFFEKEKTASDE